MIDTVFLEGAGGSVAQGSRPDQQDRFTVVLPGQFVDKVNGTLALIAVCDGHALDAVSAHAIQNLPRLVMNSPELANGNYEQAIRSAIREEDGLLYERYSQGDDKCAVAGTTVVICLVDLTNGTLIIGNLGDSHVLLGSIDKKADVEDMQVERLTRSHKPSSPSEMHRIEDAGGSINTQSGTHRIGALNMSRALGDLKYKRPVNEPVSLSCGQERATSNLGDGHGDFVSSEPTISRVDLQESKWYVLVLATDGTTDRLRDYDVVRRVATSFWNSEADAQGASSMITAQSTVQPESDNATCVSAFLRGAKV